MAMGITRVRCHVEIAAKVLIVVVFSVGKITLDVFAHERAHIAAHSGVTR